MGATGQFRNSQRSSRERCEGITATMAFRVTLAPLPSFATWRPGIGGGHSDAAANGISPGLDLVKSSAATLCCRPGCLLGAAGKFEWRTCEPRSRMRELGTSGSVGGW